MTDSTYEIWFHHPNGPYRLNLPYYPPSHPHQTWSDDPNYIGSNKLGHPEDRPPVVQEQLAHPRKD